MATRLPDPQPAQALASRSGLTGHRTPPSGPPPRPNANQHPPASVTTTGSYALALECFAATIILAKKRLGLLPPSNEMGLPKIGKPIRTVLRNSNVDPNLLRRRNSGRGSHWSLTGRGDGLLDLTFLGLACGQPKQLLRALELSHREVRGWGLTAKMCY